MERHNEISDFIWNIKEIIRDEYQEKDYEDVILPFTLLRRIDCVLEKMHGQVMKIYEQYKKNASPDVLDRLLKKAELPIEFMNKLAQDNGLSNFPVSRFCN